jgi:hypothetical protein
MKKPNVSPAPCASMKNMAVRVGPYDTIIESPYCAQFATFITGGGHGTCVGCEAFVAKVQVDQSDSTIGGEG